MSVANSYGREYTNQSIQQGPSTSSSYENRGDAYHRKGDLEQAIRDHGKAIELDPTCTAYFNRGVIFMEQQRWSEAESDFDHAWEARHNVTAMFIMRYQTITHFEKEHGVKVPEKFGAMLMQREDA